MSWFMRGVQSAVFHYASCAPCTGYMYRKKRRKQAKKDKDARQKLQSEQPELYEHPGPTGTNHYWNEEIAMGPGPPPRRAKRTNTGHSSHKGSHAAELRSTVASQAGSSIDTDRADERLRLSDDTLDDENWNRRRYQREDEDLWGFGEPLSPTETTVEKGSSVGVGGIGRPGTSKSSADSYYTARVPPVNDLHPPIVSMPSPRPAANQWMLQPPPKASIMSGKERATTRSRSGSGASSHVELSLQRQVSVRHLRQKIERGETPELPHVSMRSSYTSLIAGQRHDRPRTPQARPPSAASSRKTKRRDTAMTGSGEIDRSSGDSSDTIVHTKEDVNMSYKNSARSSPKLPPVSSLKVVRVRSSRPRLSTVISSGSGSPSAPNQHNLGLTTENEKIKRPQYISTQSSDSVHRLTKQRPPLASSDASSLNVLQDLVSPRALLSSRFVSAPLMEARIKLPPTNMEEEETLSADEDWIGSELNTSRGWRAGIANGPVPFDRLGFTLERDPRMRWSVDF